MFKRLFSRFLSRVPPVLFGRRQLAFKRNCDELNSCRDSPARFLVGVEEFLRQRGIPLVPNLLCYRADPLVYILRPDIKALSLERALFKFATESGQSPRGETQFPF